MISISLQSFQTLHQCRSRHSRTYLALVFFLFVGDVHMKLLPGASLASGPDAAPLKARAWLCSHAIRQAQQSNACLQIKIGLFGSVPIKTYLPHGDIDLTFYREGSTSAADEIPNWAHRLLKHIEQSCNVAHSQEGPGAIRGHSSPGRHPGQSHGEPHTAPPAAAPAIQCRVQSVTEVPAEVKLVKCNICPIVPNSTTIVVDISYKQYGGVNAAAFLEEADRLVDAHIAAAAGVALVCVYCCLPAQGAPAPHHICHDVQFACKQPCATTATVTCAA